MIKKRIFGWRRRPTFRSKPSSSNLIWRRKIAKSAYQWRWILVFLFNALVILVVFASPYFRIRNIEIERSSFSINANEIEDFVKKRVWAKNFFLFSAQQLAEEAMQAFPQWKEIKMTKIFPDRVSIAITNYAPMATVKISQILKEVKSNKTIQDTATWDFMINERGSITAPELNVKPELNILYSDLWTENLGVGTNLIDPFRMKQIRYLHDKLGERQQLAAQNLIFFRQGRELHFDFGKWRAWFDLNQELDPQLDKLDRALMELKIDNIQYLDLRISKRIIYKIIDPKQAYLRYEKKK
ncbi:MAG TPA: FtsQ-type POTRA domain-containing protein [Candidatus Gracilibacteria bacterium]|nr:FtsQ-type POTRA domain-containing protein [Candidatus Gracilibacteria bacterium]